MLIAGALVFNYVVTVENIPSALRVFLEGYDLSATGFLLMVNAILLVLGCILEGTTILLIVVPVFVPTAQALGIDMWRRCAACSPRPGSTKAILPAAHIGRSARRRHAS